MQVQKCSKTPLLLSAAAATARLQPGRPGLTLITLRLQVTTVVPFQSDQEAISNTEEFTSQQTSAVTDSFGC